MKASTIHHRGNVIPTDSALDAIFLLRVALIFGKVDMLGVIAPTLIFTVVYAFFIEAPDILRELLLWLHVVAFVTS